VSRKGPLLIKFLFFTSVLFKTNERMSKILEKNEISKVKINANFLLFSQLSHFPEEDKHAGMGKTILRRRSSDRGCGMHAVFYVILC
jgi:hypothetical protein